MKDNNNDERREYRRNRRVRNQILAYLLLIILVGLVTVPLYMGAQALVREIKEELSATIEVGELIDTIEYDYPTFHLSMDCFWAKLVEGELILKEAEAARWLSKDELLSVNWLPADRDLIQLL